MAKVALTCYTLKDPENPTVASLSVNDVDFSKGIRCVELHCDTYSDVKKTTFKIEGDVAEFFSNFDKLEEKAIF